MVKFHFYLFTVFLLLVLTIAYLSSIKTGLQQYYLLVNNHKISLEVANTAKAQQQGLSGRDNLPGNSGMLFSYDNSGYRLFWMKGMNFPLDFVWIDKGKIVALTANVQVADYQPPKSLRSPQKVNQVLEINAGEIEKLGIEIGQTVVLTLR